MTHLDYDKRTARRIISIVPVPGLQHFNSFWFDGTKYTAISILTNALGKSVLQCGFSSNFNDLEIISGSNLEVAF